MTTTTNPRTAHSNDRRAAADAALEMHVAARALAELCRETNGDGSVEAAELVAKARTLAGELEQLAHRKIGARLSAALKASGDA